ncbi:unnamed protein product, partial [Symbiodinium necroappetens]
AYAASRARGTCEHMIASDRWGLGAWSSADALAHWQSAAVSSWISRPWPLLWPPLRASQKGPSSPDPKPSRHSLPWRRRRCCDLSRRRCRRRRGQQASATSCDWKSRPTALAGAAAVAEVPREAALGSTPTCAEGDAQVLPFLVCSRTGAVVDTCCAGVPTPWRNHVGLPVSFAVALAGPSLRMD